MWKFFNSGTCITGVQMGVELLETGSDLYETVKKEY